MKAGADAVGRGSRVAGREEGGGRKNMKMRGGQTGGAEMAHVAWDKQAEGVVLGPGMSRLQNPLL